MKINEEMKLRAESMHTYLDGKMVERSKKQWTQAGCPMPSKEDVPEAKFFIPEGSSLENVKREDIPHVSFYYPERAQNFYDVEKDIFDEDIFLAELKDVDGPEAVAAVTNDDGSVNFDKVDMYYRQKLEEMGLVLDVPSSMVDSYLVDIEDKVQKVAFSSLS